MINVIYVTGGARSGKSSFALRLASRYEKKVFLATAEPFDDEMKSRIGKHREERGDQFITIEEPLYPEQALRILPSGSEVVLLDCLTVWAGNLMHRFDDEGLIHNRIDCFINVLDHPPCDIILVSNEVGMGIVNQKVASRATEAYLLCSGLPVRLK